MASRWTNEYGTATTMGRATAVPIPCFLVLSRTRFFLDALLLLDSANRSGSGKGAMESSLSPLLSIPMSRD